MKLLALPLSKLALLLCFASLAFAQQKAEIKTASTTLELNPALNAPALVSIRPGQGAPWMVNAGEPLIASIESGGKQIPVRWTYSSSESVAQPSRVRFVYLSAEPKLRLTWEWEARSQTGAVEHRTTIENLTGQEIWIPLQDSFASKIAVSNSENLKLFFVEKGADTPSSEGTHEQVLSAGYDWRGTSSTYAHPAKGEAREIIPYTLLQRDDSAQTGWFVGIEFSGRTAIHVKRSTSELEVSAGLNGDPPPFRTRLKDGARFETPTIFVGGFTGGPDGAGNLLRPWVREVLGHREAWNDAKYPVLVNNSWGSGMAVDEDLARRMIRDSKELGLEMFHIDAGWFRDVGDWYPSPTKFPHGLKPIADAAHEAGLKFGIWVDWTQAALSKEKGALNVNDPAVKNWLVSELPPDWKPEEFKGETVDIGVPAAHEWTKNEVHRIVKDYGLDMLEHDGYLVAQGCVHDDHPHAPPEKSSLAMHKDSGFRFVTGANSTDVSYHAVRAYYDIQSSLREEKPEMLLEVCNDGGRMVDFGSAAHADYFSITDTYDPLSNRRAFYDTSFVLPAAMLESYVEKWPVPKIENFRYMLRSGMMGWLTVMLDTTKWNEEQHQVAKDEIQFYKDELRPLIRDANLYHVSKRPDGVHWDGIEYFDPQHKRGVLFAFRGSTSTEASHVFPLQGLAANSTYHLSYRDHSATDISMKGSQLMKKGLPVALNTANSSEIVVIREESQ